MKRTIMGFINARKRLLKIAQGKYINIGFEVSGNPGKREICCSIYIDREKVYDGLTWDRAFEAREEGINKDFLSQLDKL